MTEPAYKKLTVQQTYRLGKLLEERLIIHGPNLCEYPDGYSDQTIALEIGYPSTSSISKFRIKLFGQLKKPDAPILLPKDGFVTRDEFNILVRAVRELAEEMGSSIGKFS